MSGAADRVRAYVDRRSRMRGLDKNEVHAIDVGAESEASLTVADLRELLDEISYLQRQLAQAEAMACPHF